MSYRDSQAARHALPAVAARQAGYFTAKQALAADYPKQHVSYHVSAGNFERIERGLYRLPAVPPGEHDELVRLTLWSRGRDDRPVAVVSHRSALALHDLGETLPGKVHLTVPQGFRKAAPSNVELHRGTLEPEEVERHEGYSVTRPIRTLLDVSETISMEELRAAVEDALERGVVGRAKLESAAHQARSGERLLAVLRDVE